jgi:parvulin-like peptidyl-prolyl isomerase
MNRTVRILTVMAVLTWAGVASPAERVVARVNGAPIMESQVEEAVNQMIPRASFHGSLTEERLAAFRERALEGLISYELQYQYAVSAGMKPDRKAVRARLDQVRDSFPSRGEYKDWLKRIGRTEEQLRTIIEKENLVAAARRDVVEGPAALSERQVRDYYEKNAEKFREPQSVRLRIISTKDRQKAEDALAKIAAGGDFGDIAARISEDNYRIKGGDIGYVHRGRIYPELEDAADKLEVGAVSGLLHAEGRWFILKVEDRKQARVVPYENARDKLKKDLESNKRSELSEAWLAELRGKAEIERLVSGPTGS